MIIGTTNPGKIREIAAICRPYEIPLEALGRNIPETGDTFAENALIKARAYAESGYGGHAVMAEDSGLVVASLNGLPGPWSARFVDLDLDTRRVTGTHHDGVITAERRVEIDQLNNRRLLDLMEEVPLSDRGAVFVVHLVIVRDGEILFRAEGRSHGWIASESRGTKGFGYDPVFVGNDTFGKTYAELDSTRKNLRSHRKDVLKQFSTWLAGAVKDGVSL